MIFGSPTRFGNIASQLKQFIDTLGGLWPQGKLADKVYSGFTSSATAHGGQESTLLALYNSVHHFGGLVVAPGYTDATKFADGNPYGTPHVDSQGNNPVDNTREAARIQAERIVHITTALKTGLVAPCTGRHDRPAPRRADRSPQARPCVTSRRTGGPSLCTHGTNRCGHRRGEGEEALLPPSSQRWPQQRQLAYRPE